LQQVKAAQEGHGDKTKQKDGNNTRDGKDDNANTPHASTTTAAAITSIPTTAAAAITSTSTTAATEQMTYGKFVF